MKQKKTRRRRKTWPVWVLIILAELLAAAIPAGIAAAFLLPVSFKARGEFGVGGEWLVILLLFCGAYTAIHRWFCNKLFG
ncbi:MAG: hypothetical protein K2O18_03985 [Oscillospiraceae bacterium]|nr:hypothetical protein [Oscillospiraceae bacterium]